MAFSINFQCSKNLLVFSLRECISVNLLTHIFSSIYLLISYGKARCPFDAYVTYKSDL